MNFDGALHTLSVSRRSWGPDQKIVSYHVIATRFSFTELTGTFSRQLGQVMIDRIGLAGTFDSTMDLTPDETEPNPLDPSPLITALKEQIGLTLKSEKTPVEFLVIDGAEKVAA